MPVLLQYPLQAKSGKNAQNKKNIKTCKMNLSLKKASPATQQQQTRFMVDLGHTNGLKLAYTTPKKRVVKLDIEDIDDVKETWGYCLVELCTGTCGDRHLQGSRVCHSSGNSPRFFLCPICGHECVPHYCNHCNRIGHPPSKYNIFPMESKEKKSCAQPEKQTAAEDKGVTKATKRHHQHSTNKSSGDNESLKKVGDQPLEKEKTRDNAQLSKAEGKRQMESNEPEEEQRLVLAQASEAGSNVDMSSQPTKAEGITPKGTSGLAKEQGLELAHDYDDEYQPFQV
ncbi:homeobox-leucine zipper family protein /lipid-binding START domain-containing protein, partial [Striga asiatica]